MLVPVHADAHSGLISSNPAANVEITEMPTEITLTFTEELMTIGDEAVNTISLQDPNGQQIILTNTKVEGAVLSSQLAQGNYISGGYTVSYKIVSADGHKLSGSYGFSLNAPVAVSETSVVEDEKPSALPLPIVIALAALISVGGFLIYSKRRREE